MSQHKNKRVMGKAVAGALAMAMVIGNFAVCAPVNAYAEEGAETTVRVTQEAVDGLKTENNEYLKDAQAAVTAAVAKQGEAEQAKTDAETAEDDAEAEQQKAEAAKREAETAKTNAETAKTNAETAKGDAEVAKTNAETAKGDAETAKTNAETAKGDAEVAKTNAETAKGAADTAKTDADAAKGAADAAKNNAEIAKGNVADAKNNADAEAKKAAEATDAANRSQYSSQAEQHSKDAEAAMNAAQAAAAKAVDEANNAAEAVKNAENIKKALDTAKANADAAQSAYKKAETDVNEAQKAAEEAQSAAKGAAEAAEAAKEAATTAESNAAAAKLAAEAAMNALKKAYDDAVKAEQAAKVAAEAAEAEAEKAATAAGDLETASEEGTSAADEAKKAAKAAEAAKMEATTVQGGAAKALADADADKKADGEALVKTATDLAEKNSAGSEDEVENKETAKYAFDQAAQNLENKQNALINDTYNAKIKELEDAINSATDETVKAEKTEELVQEVLKHALGTTELGIEENEGVKYYTANGSYYGIKNTQNGFEVYEYEKSEKDAVEEYSGSKEEMKKYLDKGFSFTVINNWGKVVPVEWRYNIFEHEWMFMYDASLFGIISWLPVSTDYAKSDITASRPVKIPVYTEKADTVGEGYVNGESAGVMQGLKNDVESAQEAYEKADAALTRAKKDYTWTSQRYEKLYNNVEETPEIAAEKEKVEAELLRLAQIVNETEVAAKTMKATWDTAVNNYKAAIAAQATAQKTKNTVDGLAKDLTEAANAAAQAAQAAQAAADAAAGDLETATGEGQSAADAAVRAADAADAAAEIAANLKQLAADAAKLVADAQKAAEDAATAKAAADAAAQAVANKEAEVNSAVAAVDAAKAEVEKLKTDAGVSEEEMNKALEALGKAQDAAEWAKQVALDAQNRANDAKNSYNTSLGVVAALKQREEEMRRAYADYMAWLASQETIEDEQVPLADLSASEGREIRTFGDEMYIYDAEGKLVKNEFSVFEDENGKLYMVFTNEKGIIVKNMFIVEDEDGNYELVTAEAMNEDEDIDFEEVFVYWAGEDGIIVRDDEVEVLDYIYTADEEGVIVSREEKEEEAIA